MVNHECLVCGKFHQYQADYFVCEFTVLEGAILELSEADMATLSQYLYPRGKPDVGVVDCTKTQR